MRTLHLSSLALLCAAFCFRAPISAAPVPANPPAAAPAATPVSVDNFIRAETDLYFAQTVKLGAFGKLVHARDFTPIDQQTVVRMNRDTLYSSGVFDLDAAPVTVTLPDPAGHYMALQAVSEDHFTVQVADAPGAFTFTREQVGTRYLFLIVRILPPSPRALDLKNVQDLQDKIQVVQKNKGRFETPRWDKASQDQVRGLLQQLAALGGKGERFGSKTEVDPVSHLLGTATGWGGNPQRAAAYEMVVPKANDGQTVHTLTVRDVPVDGFWSISVYNARGYFDKNELGIYSVNNLGAVPNRDGSTTIQFGGCRPRTTNCLPITPEWNYAVRLYRPRAPILDGSWTFPEAKPILPPAQ